MIILHVARTARFLAARCPRFCCASAALICCLIARPSSAALTVAGYTAANAGMYDRFLNDPSFIGNPSNWPAGDPTGGANPNPWSGIGQDPTGRWGSMISPSYFVSATHFAPGTSLQFYYTNDPSGTSEVRTIASGMTNIGGSDLWLGKLDAPVSSNVKTYPILNLPTTGSINNPDHFNQYGGLSISVMGLSDSNINSQPATDMRMGTNIIAPSPPFGNNKPVQQVQVQSGPTGWVYAYNYLSTIPGNAFLQGGDSGGPTFFLYAGASPALVGVHWFNNDSPPLSGDTFIPAYLSDLQTAMSGSGENPTAVAPLKGDFDLNGVVNAADLPAMLNALTDLSGYQTRHGLSTGITPNKTDDGYLQDIGDFNGDHLVNNKDIQGLLNLLTTMGIGSFDFASVPEPDSIGLLALGAGGVFWLVRRKTRLSSFSLAQCT